ncbi:hypothetical protein [Hymenobacter pini]|uniref:hypothetical protein n=1 Tax=Hymenobacter pini TaxID=2880879 RepID=UPI001CF17838|nr:hypothetical protein [Hymenobacter pini]MCA8830555.1 hypothetical protein [Hymenobacter pini]
MAKQPLQLTLTVASSWASTNPGTTKYHYYDGNGQSLCSYERKEGTLHPYTGTEKIPADACSSCKLHYQKGHHLEAAAPAPKLVLPAETRVRVLKGKYAGAFGRIQRYDEHSRKYCVSFGKKVFDFLGSTEIEEAPL